MDGMPGLREIRGAVVAVNLPDVAFMSLTAIRPSEVGVDAAAFEHTECDRRVTTTSFGKVHLSGHPPPSRRVLLRDSLCFR